MNDSGDGGLFRRLSDPDKAVRRKAFGAAYDLYAPMFLPFLRRYWDAETARDILHDLFVQLLSSAALNDHPNPRKFMWRALINKHMDHLRKLARQPTAMPFPGDEILDEVVADGTVDTLAEQEARELLECASRALAELGKENPTEAWAIEVAAVSGLTARELQEAFGSRSTHAATERLSRARAKLRGFMEKICGPFFSKRATKRR